MVNVLVVDDIKFIRLSLGLTLKNEKDMKIFDAGSVESAIKILDKQSIDLLLLDLDLSSPENMRTNSMESFDGLDILDYIKANNLHMPHVIVLSGTVDVNKAVRAHNYGVRDVLSKPIKPDKLLKLIREVRDSITQVTAE